jgi:5-methylcytosine-specific restriction endonuclease McrA
MTAYVELYNAGGTQFIKRVSIQKAMNMLWRGVARTLEVDEGYFGGFERPRSLELVRYVVTKWMYERNGTVSPTRKLILKRDNYTCAYCGKTGSTIDHIQPQSRGGQNTWLNLVTACQKCNNVKDDRTPKEAKMKLLFEPREPKFSEIYAWGRT